MGRCKLNDQGECIANTPIACVCAELRRLESLSRAFEAVFGPPPVAVKK
jgi:hypothetical protein